MGTVIVVDDGSSDPTSDLAYAAGAVVVRHPQKMGYDHAIKTGIEFAREKKIDVVITFDADGQHDSEVVRKIIDIFELQKCDVVIGTRDKPARLAEYLFNKYVRYRFGIDDILCGLKGYRLSEFSKYRLENIAGSIGTKMALDGLRSGLKVCTVPVQIAGRQGKPRMGSSLRANYKIGKALLRTFVDDLTLREKRA